MAGLMVGVTGCTGLKTETLAIANNSLGSLHFAGATRTGTGSSGSHHNRSTHCCMGQEKMLLRPIHYFHTHAEILITILIPYTCLAAKSYLANRNNPKSKKKC